MSDSTTHEYLYRVFVALDLGYLNAEQAIESVQHLHQTKTQEPLAALRQLWFRREWMAKEEWDEICEAEAFAALDKFKPLPVGEKPNTLTLSTLEDARPYLQVFQHVLEAEHSSDSLVTRSLLKSTEGPGERPSSSPENSPSNKLSDDEVHTPSKSDNSWRPIALPHERYEEGRELGKGGLGTVVEVFDQNLGRKVARKTLHEAKAVSPKQLKLLIDEARVTGQLEHPNIVPIYEIGELPGGDVYYTMRLLPPNNLDWAIYQAETSILEMVKILQQVCMGLEYAHSLGVVHRDIKPSNILLGQFGEVLIIDWGVAKVFEETSLKLKNKESWGTEQAIKGTPSYMAPELIEQGSVSPKVDQYALGVILYEVLTKALPFHSDLMFQLLMSVIHKEPVPPSSLNPDVPEELEQICLKMLAKKPEERFASCREVYDRLEEFLDGTKERERRRMASEARIEEARQLSNQYKENLQQAEELAQSLEEKAKGLKLWDPVEKKRELWDVQEQLKQTTQEGIKLFRAAIKAFEQALEHEPRNPQARRGLADLYWSKLLEAEQQHDDLQQLFYAEAVASYDDGTYAALLKGDGTLQLTSEPTGANIRLFRYEEEDCHLVPKPVALEAKTPVEVPLAMGSYLLELEHEGFQTVRYPVCLSRCEERSAHVRLFREEQLGEGYILIPGGSFPFGGDPEAPMGLPLELVPLDDFLIATYPVTFREYLAFLNEVHQQDPELAESMVPQADGEKYARLAEDESYIPNWGTLFHGPIVKRYLEGAGHEWNLPILGVSWFDAVRYCRWRSEKEGRRITLPTEQQWEKAAAGDDRRIYPWGSQFEATYCKMGRSREPEELQAEPVGTFPRDRSPYGVCDMVGTISEWTLSYSQDEVDAMTQDPKQTVIQRGGGWIASNEPAIRIGNRVPRQDGGRSYNTGFRVVTYPLPGKDKA